MGTAGSFPFCSLKCQHFNWMRLTGQQKEKKLQSWREINKIPEQSRYRQQQQHQWALWSKQALCWWYKGNDVSVQNFIGQSLSPNPTWRTSFHCDQSQWCICTVDFRASAVCTHLLGFCVTCLFSFVLFCLGLFCFFYFAVFQYFFILSISKS